MTIPKIVNVSGGRTSGYLAYLCKGKPNHYFMFQNTGREREETLVFLDRMDKEWNLNLIWMEYDIDDQGKVMAKRVDFETACRDGEPFEKIIDKVGRVPSLDQRFCTNELKTRTARRYIRKIMKFDEWYSYIGYRVDEPKRHGGLNDWVGKKVRFKKVAPLVNLNITANDVGEFWRNNDFDLKLPMLPNGKTVGGNCKGCFFHSEYQHAMLCRNAPKDVDWLIRQEEKFGKTFNHNYSFSEMMEQSKKTESLFNDELESELYCDSEFGSCGD